MNYGLEFGWAALKKPWIPIFLFRQDLMLITNTTFKTVCFGGKEDVLTGVESIFLVSYGFQLFLPNLPLTGYRLYHRSLSYFRSFTLQLRYAELSCVL
jgi:hypothetical protein